MVAVIGAAIVLLLGYIDVSTGFEISFSIFYFIPIMFVTWYGKRLLGILISTLSAVVWLLCDIYSGHTYSNSIIPYWNCFMRYIIFIFITYLLSAVRTYAERERDSSRIDSLTGIGNGKLFYEIASKELERLDRYGNVFSLVYMDLDNFKTINDSFGHNAGDNLLRIVAAKIRVSLRAIDTVARLGGDEFAVLLPESNSEKALSVFTRIQTELLEEMKKNNWPVTFSMGIATFRTPLESVDALVAKADSLMYEVKSSGKNNILAKEY